MVCPLGSVNTSDHPLIAVVPVLVMVSSEVRPVFQALTVSVTRQAPGSGSGSGSGSPLWNWVKNRHTSADVQVRQPSPPPSTGAGVWPPSNAAHTTGYPDRHPV